VKVAPEPIIYGSARDFIGMRKRGSEGQIASAKALTHIGVIPKSISQMRTLSDTDWYSGVNDG